MEWISEAFERRWYYVGALLVAIVYGLGGLVHIGNVLGFGEMKWIESPVAWRVGDVWWGALDVAAVVGVVMKSPVGILAIALAAASQVVAYVFYPHLFALTESHHATLRGLVYFNAAVLVVLVTATWIAGAGDGS